MTCHSPPRLFLYDIHYHNLLGLNHMIPQPLTAAAFASFGDVIHLISTRRSSRCRGNPILSLWHQYTPRWVTIVLF